eukprot:CAMPEP_0171636272 /NCGR_PEP_ID=MMETSP0990-20121206/27297_1 /TAXON_ID=483369 /ORGANISM="non described non described, Strain CCMP2098" /LENGTH=75 /DNA_ID=CAMNT_0012208343 /DNA_START=125 /DNA_END=352 /DNA_ORIENTATION=-
MSVQVSVLQLGQPSTPASVQVLVLQLGQSSALAWVEAKAQVWAVGLEPEQAHGRAQVLETVLGRAQVLEAVLALE